MSIQTNIQEVRQRIAAACGECGRDPKEITLVGASKMNDAAACREAIAAGIDVLGENRVQEMTAHLDDNAYAGSALHFIGHLQTNKVKYVVGRVDMIESVDSLRLAQEISRQSMKREITTPVLLEVNIGGEESKTGMAPAELEETACAIAQMPGIQVCGLMAIPPICEEESVLRGFFSDMRRFFVDMKAKKIDNINMDILSMGMSGDYVQAIEEGANLVRVGSALFGARVY